MPFTDPYQVVETSGSSHAASPPSSERRSGRVRLRVLRSSGNFEQYFSYHESQGTRATTSPVMPIATSFQSKTTSDPSCGASGDRPIFFQPFQKCHALSEARFFENVPRSDVALYGLSRDSYPKSGRAVVSVSYRFRLENHSADRPRRASDPSYAS